MIARLIGEVLESDGERVVVLAGGVGYEVYVGAQVPLAAPGARIDLVVRQVWAQDGSTRLYGFRSAEERRIFDLLSDVKGCGAKTSIALLGTLGSEGTVRAILSQDARALAKAPGVGARLAERVLVELRDKVGTTSMAAAPSAAPADDLLEALMALGYRRAEAETAAAEARAESPALEEQVRLAIRRLSR